MTDRNALAFSLRTYLGGWKRENARLLPVNFDYKK
jgi:hypothetical protein